MSHRIITAVFLGSILTISLAHAELGSAPEWRSALTSDGQGVNQEIKSAARKDGQSVVRSAAQATEPGTQELADALRVAKRAGDEMLVSEIERELGWVEDVPGPPPTLLASRVVRSTHLSRGAPWQEDVLVNNPQWSSGHPALAARSNGTLFVVVDDLLGNYLDIYTSTDGGFVWEYLFSLYTTDQNATNPSIVIGEGVKNRLLIAYEYGAGTGDAAIHVYYLDLDTQENRTVIVAASALGVTHPEICVDSPEYGVWYPYLSYVRGTFSEQDRHDVMFSRSTNYGDSWSTPVALATDVSESDPPDIDYGDANLYLVYTRVYAPGDRDIFVRRSTNLGMNWDSEVTLANSTDDEFEPRVAATYGGGAVVASFTRDYGAGNTDIECSRSTDAGATWTWSYLPYNSEAEARSELTVSPSLGQIHAVFLRGRDVEYTAADHTAPGTWSPAETINEDNGAADWSRPCVAAHPLRSPEQCVAWMDSRFEPPYRVYFDAAYGSGGYAIITRQSLLGSVEPLANWKASLGYDVSVTTLEWILTTYPGIDDAERIWNYLHENYASIRYVLLVGDIDVLPMRRLYPDGNPGDLRGYGTDYYYAKLDVVSWDVDGDDRWGEFAHDSLDPEPDVLVGRIPFNNQATVATICQNLIDFEQNTGSWKRNALFAHGFMDIDTDGALVAELLHQNLLDPQGWTRVTLYEQGGLEPSQFPSTEPLSQVNFQGMCGLGIYGVVNCLAHGEPYRMTGQRWDNDCNGNGNPDYDLDEIEWTDFSLHYAIPAHPVSSLVFLCGCSSAVVYGNDPAANLSPLRSRYLIRTPRHGTMLKNYLQYGAPAVIGSTAGSEYEPGWSQPGSGHGQSLNYYFHEELIGSEWRAGDAFYRAMLRYVQVHGFNRAERVFNYYGDPSLRIAGVPTVPEGRSPVVTVHGVGVDARKDAGIVLASSQVKDGPLGSPMLEQPPVWIEGGEIARASRVTSLIEDSGALYAGATAFSEEGRSHGAIFRSTDEGGTWTEFELPDQSRSVTALVVEGDGALILTGATVNMPQPCMSVVFRSEDHGQTWTTPLVIPDVRVTDILRTRTGSLLASTGNGLVFRSTDDGVNWDLLGEVGENRFIHALFESSELVLLAGVSYGEGPTGAILRSENGVDWFPVAGLGRLTNAVYDFTEAADHVYAGVRENGHGYVYRSAIDGAEWARLPALPDGEVVAVRSLARGPEDRIFAGTEVTTGRSATRVFAMTVVPAPGDWEPYGGFIDVGQSVRSLIATWDAIFAGTALYGVPGYGKVHRAELSGVVDVDDGNGGEAPPLEFRIEQNVPNPFNPRTTIRYTLPGRAVVDLTVLDVQGRRIRWLKRGVPEAAGSHAVIWDGLSDTGEAMASGVYFCRLEAGAFRESRRMVLVR